MTDTVPAAATGLPSTRRRFLRGLAVAPLAAAAPALIAGSPAAAVAPDPTFALIEAHRAAWGYFETVVDEYSGTLADEPPNYVARRQAASDAETEAMEALLTLAPTTLAGLRAFAEHMLAHDVKMNGTIYADEHERWALETIVEACRELIPANGKGDVA